MCVLGGVHAHLCISELFTLKSPPTKRNIQARKGWKLQECLCVELPEGVLGGTDVLTTTGAALWYKQGEQSSLVIRINTELGDSR